MMKRKEMTYHLKLKPLSTNEAWQGRRFKTPKYKSFEKEMLFILPKIKEPIPEMIRLELFFGFSNQASDIDNPAKMVIDCLQKKYKFNDKQIFELNIRKCLVKKGSEFIDFGIYPCLPFE